MAGDVVVEVFMGEYSRIGRLMARFRRRARIVNVLTFDDAAKAVAENNRLVFESQGAFGGHPWPPLSPRYAAWKLRMVGARPILVFSGDLKDGLTHRPMSVERLTHDGYEFGTNDPKAKWHQHGTRTPMPARPPVQSSEWLSHELQRLVRTGVTG